MENKTHSVFGEMRRYVAGIDLAWRADHYVCGPRNEDGSHDIASFGTTTPELYKMLKWLQERKVESVAVESTSVYWIPTADLLESKGIEVILVDPREVRTVPGRKSDLKDCQWLQKLHSSGLLHGAFRPSESIVAIRSILREKETMTAMRTQSIQQMQKSLDQMNIRVHHAVSDIDGKTGTAIIKAIIDGERDPVKLAKLRDKRCKQSERQIADHLTGTWRPEHLFNLEQAFKTMQFLDERIAEYDRRVLEMFSALSATIEESDEQKPSEPMPSRKQTHKEKKDVVGKEIIRKIMKFNMPSIPGVGLESSFTLASELGNNFDRFPTEHHFVSYIGLAPSLGKSAGKNIRQRHKCKNTSRAGRTLRMCAATLYRSNTALGAYFRSVAGKTDRKTAVKATARRMAQIIYRGVKYGQSYIDSGQVAYEAYLHDKTVKTISKLIKRHNISKLEIENALT